MSSILRKKSPSFSLLGLNTRSSKLMTKKGTVPIVEAGTVEQSIRSWLSHCGASWASGGVPGLGCWIGSIRHTCRFMTCSVQEICARRTARTAWLLCVNHHLASCCNLSKLSDTPDSKMSVGQPCGPGRLRCGMIPPLASLQEFLHIVFVDWYVVLALKISYGTLVCNATTNQGYKTSPHYLAN